MSEQSRIEDDIARTRVRMDARLNDLQDRMTPRRIADDVLCYLQGSDSGEFVRNLATSAKTHPVPAVVSGIGLAWLMAVNGRPGSEPNHIDRQDIRLHDPVPSPTVARPWSNPDEFDRHFAGLERDAPRGTDEPETTYRDRLHDAKGKALGIARDAKDTSASYAERVSEAAASVRLSLRQSAHDLADGTAGTYKAAAGGTRQAAGYLGDQARSAGQAGGDLFGKVMENPMILGAIGLGVGALLGALVPRTDAETQALGGIAGDARDAFRETSQEVLDRGSDAAGEALAAGQSSAQEHGLTGNKDLGDLAQDAGRNKLSGNVADVAKSALAAAGESLNDHGTPKS